MPLRVLLPLALAASLSVAHADAWVLVRTANFELLSDATPAVAEEAARELEAFRAALARVAPPPPEALPPVAVYAFRDDASFAPFFPVFRGRRQPVGGFAQVGPDRSVIAFSLAAGAERRRLAAHEYAHLFLGRALSAPPPWLAEGLAELFSGWRVEDGRVVLGDARREHLEDLGGRPWMPLADLARVHHDSAAYNETERRGIFYAQSWALAHWLLLGRDPGTPPDLGALARAAEPGDAAGALRAAAGRDLETLAGTLRAYLAGPLPEWRLEAAPDEPPTELTVASPGRAEVEWRLGELLALRGRADDARARFQDALGADPEFAPAHLSLAGLLVPEGDFARARGHLETARRLRPSDPMGLYRYADLLVQEGLQRGVALSAADEAAAGTALREALRRAPWFAEACELLVRLEGDGGDTDELLALTERAQRLNPGRAELSLALARLHARRQDVGAARRALERAQRTSREESTRLVAGLSLGRVRDYEAKTAEARGLLTRLVCHPDGALEFVVEVEDRYLRLRAASARDVFLYRPNGAPLELTLVCGEQGAPVVARYVPEPAGAARAAGTLLTLTFR